MVSEKEIEAALSGWHRALIDAHDEPVDERRRRCIRAALSAAARVRAEAAEGGEVVAPIPLGKGNVIDGGGANISQPLHNKHITIRDREAHPAPQPSGPVGALPYDEAMRVVASLAAAISLLERSPKTAAPSDRMFDQMLTDYRNALGAARSALTAGKPVPSGWQPIETAPKDGTEILSDGPHGVVIIHWMKENYFGDGAPARWFPVPAPTRWMPLPDTSTAGGEDA